jgi:hypothetical protein
MGSLYERDLVAWTEEQAALLRSGKLREIDAAHLAEEIESLGSSERRELRNRFARLLQHLLTWQFQPALRSRSWATTIRVQRDEMAGVLEDSPSLRATLPGLLPRAYALGRGWALEETDLLDLPDTCPWTVEQTMAPDFLPE